MKLYKLAVFGNPIAHSLSPQIHNIFAQQTNINIEYKKQLIIPDKFEQEVYDFFKNGGYGLNITLPFKERAYKLSVLQTKRCISAKAANTLMLKDGKIYADNTDGHGFIKDITKYIDLKNKSILIIGAGGAARGIVSALLEYKITVTNRTFLKALQLQKDFNNIPKICELTALKPEYDIIVNTTSSNHELNIANDVIAKANFCYDLSYNRPLQRQVKSAEVFSKNSIEPKIDLQTSTIFVDNARRLGVHAIDGIGMLIEQAALAYETWFSVLPNTMGLEKQLMT